MPVADPFLSKRLNHCRTLLDAITATAAANGYHRPIERNRRLVRVMPGKPVDCSTLARSWNRWLSMKNVPDRAGLAQVVQAAKRCRWLPPDLSGGPKAVADYVLSVTFAERNERIERGIRELRDLTIKLFERKDLRPDDALLLLPTLLSNLTQVLIAQWQSGSPETDIAIVRKTAEQARQLVESELVELVDELKAASPFEVVEIEDMPSADERAYALAEFEAEQEALAKVFNPKGMHVRFGRRLKRVR